MNKTILVIVQLLLTGILLSACSSGYSVSSNIDKNKIVEYYSASNVKIFQSEDDFKGWYKYAGVVEGESCQIKAHLAPPNEIDARTQARFNANKLKANAIIFTGCVSIPDKRCIGLKICYGKAYNIEL